VGGEDRACRLCLELDVDTGLEATRRKSGSRNDNGIALRVECDLVIGGHVVLLISKVIRQERLHLQSERDFLLA